MFPNTTPRATKEAENLSNVKRNDIPYILLSAGALSINLLFLTALIKSWKIVKQKRFTYHVANLALADGFVGAATLATFTVTDHITRTMMAKLTWAFTLTSLTAVCMMAIERAIVIKRPHDWGEILTLNRTLTVMAVEWLIPTNLVLIEHFYKRSHITMRFVLLILFIVAIMVTTIMYVNVYWQLYKYKGLHPECLASPEERKRRLYHKKVGSLVICLTALLMITVLPSFLTLLTKYSCLLFALNCSQWKSVNDVFYYLYMLELVNFILNPLMYFWRVPMYRKAFSRTFGKLPSSVNDDIEMRKHFTPNH